MLPSDIDQLTAATTARVFSAMVFFSLLRNPVREEDQFDRRVREMLGDMGTALGVAQSHPEKSLAEIYMENAHGHYDHDVVAFGLEETVKSIAPAFSGMDAECPGSENCPKDPLSALAIWMRRYGDSEHGISWLVQQTAQLLVADATMPVVH
ncbi:hypothetical protein ACSSZE_14645 [Acidithiobacillus caldus]